MCEMLERGARRVALPQAGGWNSRRCLPCGSDQAPAHAWSEVDDDGDENICANAHAHVGAD